MKKLLLLFFSFLFINFSYSQGQEVNKNKKQNVLRLNFLNPGIEFELSLSENSKIATNIGIGVSFSYPNTTAIQPATNQTFISPFIDIHYKNIYNFDSRISKNKNINYNSGNFIGIKLNARGNTIYSDITRTDNFDFSIGPTWGMQRSYNRINFLFDIGPVYYSDIKGNNGFYPLMFEFSVGYNILTNK